jgi:hypothetical protein
MNNNQILLHKAISWLDANNVEITRLQAIKLMFFIWFYHKKGLTDWSNWRLGAFNNKVITWLEEFADDGILEHTSSMYNYSLKKRAAPFKPCSQIEFMFRNWKEGDIADYSEEVLLSLGVNRGETTLKHSGDASHAKDDKS